MKIAVLIANWKNGSGTGVTRYFSNLIIELTKNQDLDIHILYRFGEDPEHFKIDGLKYFFPLKALLVLHKIKPDVVYMDTNWYFLCTGLLSKKMWKSKIVTTVHSHPKQASRAEKILMKYLLSECDTITFVSKGLRNILIRNWDFPTTARKEITYAGVKSVQIKDEDIIKFKRSYRIKDNSIVLLMQSSPIAKVKMEGTKVLIQSVKSLVKIYPNLILIITGIGPYLQELMDFSEGEGISQSIIFTGWVDEPFIPLALCDIYTHISLGEGLPLALLEAMSIGKPIVATPVGGIPEVIEHKNNGLLVDPNVEDVSKAIDTLLSDTELRVLLGHNAFCDSKKYSWESCAQKFTDIFEGRDALK